ncbi:MAG: hypothetical protein E7517_04590 [Ruminococcaceae bacterium]|nr:hypothetical protein [Oscillospiraceae bacterium]
MKTNMKIISLALCFVMLFCMLPLSVHATEVIENPKFWVALPAAGEQPQYDYARSAGAFLPDTAAGQQNGVEWVDVSEENRLLQPTETFQNDHEYQINIAIVADEGSAFADAESFKATLNDTAVTDFAVIHIEGVNCKAIIRFTFHLFKDNVLEKASYKKSGTMTRVCTACGYETEPQVIPRAGEVALSYVYYRYKGLMYNGKNHFPAVVVYEYGTEDEDTLSAKFYKVTYPASDAKVGTYRYTVTLRGDKYEGTAKGSYTVHLGVPGVTAKVGADKVALSWLKIQGAKFYIVYALNYKTGKFSRIAKTTKLSYTITGRKPGTKYGYAVRAGFYNKAGKEVLSPFNKITDTIEAYTLCKAPVAKGTAAGKTVTLKWAKCAGAAYYKIYAYQAKTKKYTTLVGSTKNLIVKLKNQSKGTHYYLVRAYNKEGMGSKYSTGNLVKVIVK